MLAGMPHNVTIEMDLALWQLAQRAGQHRDLLLEWLCEEPAPDLDVVARRLASSGAYDALICLGAVVRGEWRPTAKGEPGWRSYHITGICGPLAAHSIGALAVETFSRVASFASAFIPANLGALEASSLAAVTAVAASLTLAACGSSDDDASGGTTASTEASDASAVSR